MILVVDVGHGTFHQLQPLTWEYSTVVACMYMCLQTTKINQTYVIVSILLFLPSPIMQCRCRSYILYAFNYIILYANRISFPEAVVGVVSAAICDFFFHFLSPHLITLLSFNEIPGGYTILSV